MSQEDGQTELTIIGIAVAAVISSALASGGYGFWDTIVGLILLPILLHHWNAMFSSIALEAAYSGATIYTVLMIFGVVFDRRWGIWASDEQATVNFWEAVGASDSRDIWCFSAWLVLTLALLIWRRSRR